MLQHGRVVVPLRTSASAARSDRRAADRQHLAPGRDRPGAAWSSSWTRPTVDHVDLRRRTSSCRSTRRRPGTARAAGSRRSARPRSLTKPRNIARDRLVNRRSCPVLPSGQAQEDVLQRGALDRRPASASALASPASDVARVAVAMDSETPSSATWTRPGQARPWPRSGPRPARTRRDPQRLVELADQRGGRARLEDLAVVHDRDPVAQRLGLVHVVGGQHDGPALSC